MIRYLPYIASAGAFACAFLTTQDALDRRRRNERQKELKHSVRASGDGLALQNGLDGIVMSQVIRFDAQKPAAELPGWLQGVASSRARSLSMPLIKAGMSEVDAHSAALWQIRAAGLAGLAGLAAGVAVAPAAALAPCICAALVGWFSLPWALKSRAAQRRRMLERHVSEAVEVICLGLRAGLSFDRSLELYCSHFPTVIGGELEAARQTWNTGLLTREAALRNLSAAYDSQVFARMCDSIVRSLRFGSPLATSLEDLAREARASHRAQVEESVMKAPVKMMVPIGLLILPSMMLLVMGPIVLELLDGF